MQRRNLLGAVFTVVGLAACASGGAATSGSDASAGGNAPGPRWTGSFQPTQQRTGNVAVTGQNRAFGSITIDPPSGGSMQRLKVHLTASIPTAASQQVRWAIIPDRCGSGDLPVIGFEQFPLIEFGNNGRGELTVNLPLDLIPNNVYHVNVYDGNGQQLDNVLTCGNLKYEVKK